MIDREPVNPFQQYSNSIVSKLILFGMMGVIFVPLGVWKLIDICVWLFHHVSIQASIIP